MSWSSLTKNVQSLTSSHGSVARTEKSQLSNPLLSTILIGCSDGVVSNDDGGNDLPTPGEEDGVLISIFCSGAVVGGIDMAS